MKNIVNDLKLVHSQCSTSQERVVFAVMLPVLTLIVISTRVRRALRGAAPSTWVNNAHTELSFAGVVLEDVQLVAAEGDRAMISFVVDGPHVRTQLSASGALRVEDTRFSTTMTLDTRGAELLERWAENREVLTGSIKGTSEHQGHGMSLARMELETVTTGGPSEKLAISPRRDA